MCFVLTRMGTAYHEAGHAVASYAAWPQHPVESATIIPADGYLDMVRPAEQDGSWLADVEDEGMAAALAAESGTVVYLAGYLAEARFLDGITEMANPFDRTLDSLGAQDASSDTWDGEAKPIHHVYAYWSRTWDHLRQPEVWLAVAPVAGALLHHDELSAREIEAIVSEAGVEHDPEREPLFAPSDEDEEAEAFSWDRW
jgi:hypothetical protein